MLDAIELKVLRHLMNQGRMSWSDLAGRLGLSAPATAERVRRLEERGVIQSYAALVNPQAIGYGLMAFVSVNLEHPRHREAFLQRVQELPEIQECHHVTGDDDFLLKVRCRDTGDLERLITEGLKSVPGLLRTRTIVVLRTTKETPSLPLPDEGG